MTEERLQKRLQRREPEALEDLMEQYKKLLYITIANVLGRTGTHGDIEELVSDTFLAVWNYAENIQPGNLKAYLCTTARNKAKSFLRSRKTLPMDLDEIEVSTTADSPEEAVLQKELSRQVKRAIHKMRPKDKEIFLRYYYYLQNTEEISQKMNIPASTVRSRLARGRRILEKYLSKEALF